MFTRRPTGLHFLPLAVLFLGAVAAPATAQGTFSRTGDSTVGHNLGKGALLKDGRFLVTGGTRTGDTVSVINKEADIYDPDTGKFTATGPMSIPRLSHAVVALDDGSALVVGGDISDSNAAKATRATEIFDAKTNTFKAAADMSGPRQDATATLLKDGRVAVLGGYFPEGDTAFFVRSIDIFDPKANTFTLGAALPRSRWLHVALGLPDGRVMVLGGYAVASGQLVAPTEVDIYDPATDTATTVGKLNVGRINATATLLPDGKVLVAGGLIQSDDLSTTTPSDTYEVFDPKTGTSSTPAKMSEARFNHVAVALADGRVLLAGGTTGTSSDRTKYNSTNTADQYDPLTGKLTATSPLLESRTQAAAALLKNGKILITGGARLEAGAVKARLSTAELYTP